MYDKKQNPEKRFVLAGKALSVSTPVVMGILNVTPDSFSDGGEFSGMDAAMQRIGEMVAEGAAIIDVGGESTRPGSDPVSEEEELKRVVPILEKAVPRFPGTMFSVDTTKYEVAKQALECGVDMVNDVSGLQSEPRLADLCARYQAILVIMHSKGIPKIMQKRPEYRNVVQDVARFLNDRAALAARKGVEQIVIDPGIGFGKNLQHNLELVAGLHSLKALGYPIMVGASRKTVIGKILADDAGDRPVHDRLAGTIALHYHALVQGTDILRVHDVREASDSIEVFKALTSVF